MKSIRVNYNEETDEISGYDGAESESWLKVCEKFNDDVHRLRNVVEMGTYTGLYECFDDDNKKCHYIVEEDKDLYRVKHKNFYKSLGI